MGFWNKVGKIAGNVIENAPAIIEALQKEGAKKQAELHKRAENRISDYEKKVTLAAKSNKMNDPAYARKVHEEKEKIKKARINLYTGNSNIKTVEIKENGDVTFGGLTLSQWDSRWIYLGTLSSLSLENLQTYNKSIGLYKAEMNGEIAYLGRAIEYNNGGFRKRLRDYVRNSDSARTHGSGKKCMKALIS